MNKILNKNKMVTILLLTVSLLITFFVAYNIYLHNSGVILGHGYTKNNIYGMEVEVKYAFDFARITNTTREIPLELIYQFDVNEQMDYRYYGYFFDVLTIDDFKKDFGIDLNIDNKKVLISHGRKIGQLIYDVNWRGYYYEKEWGYIAVPKYERGFDKEKIYVYTSDFSLDLYNGRWNIFKFSAHGQYIDDEPKWEVELWTEKNPSRKRIWWLNYVEWSYRLFPEEIYHEDKHMFERYMQQKYYEQTYLDDIKPSWLAE